MHSEQKPIYLCRNSKEAFKLSQHFNSKEKVMALHDFINNLFKKHPNINRELINIQNCHATIPSWIKNFIPLDVEISGELDDQQIFEKYE